MKLFLSYYVPSKLIMECILMWDPFHLQVNIPFLYLWLSAFPKLILDRGQEALFPARAPLKKFWFKEEQPSRPQYSWIKKKVSPSSPWWILEQLSLTSSENIVLSPVSRTNAEGMKCFLGEPWIIFGGALRFTNHHFFSLVVEFC